MEWNLNFSNTRIIPCEFKYYEPLTLDEAIDLLEKFGEEAKVIAGGTDLLVQIKIGLVKPKYIVNIKKIKELEGISDKGDHLIIGALTRLRVIEKNEIIKKNFYALYEAIKSMASIQIRNMATIGGNLCNASPAADTAPPLLVYNAELIVYGSQGYRTIPIEKFFKGPKRTVLKYNEILVYIKIPYVKKRHSSTFIKIARTSMDLAKASVAVKLVLGDNDEIEDISIALGSVAPTPIRAKSVEKYLLNKKFDIGIIREASKLVLRDIKPVTDIRSTSEYRQLISQVIVYDALIKAYNKIRGETS